MVLSRTRFIGIVVILTNGVLPNFGELIVLRHPPTADGSTRKLTCLSEDDGSALIWNYEPEKWEENTFTNFEPARPTSEDIRDCAIWNSTTCIAEWDRYGGWQVVNSFENPMGPVFDYRWEGFEEFAFGEPVDEEKCQYVRKMSESSYTSVFSVRGTKSVNIFLCRDEDRTTGPCLWINIGGQEGKQSTIRFCEGGAPYAVTMESAGCVLMAVKKHDEDIINESEWRTFRLSWVSDKSTIEVSHATQNNQFLYKLIEPRQRSLGHVSIGSDKTTRVRFHFYDYLLTNEVVTTISTRNFPYYDNFCIEMLFGVCKECGIIVDMVGDRNHLLETVKITGDETSELDGIMTWNSVEIKLSSRNVNPQNVKLEMRSRLDGKSYKGNYQWAIGGLRTCKSGGSLRVSTITARKELRSHSTGEWQRINCQKLSYDINRNAVIDSFSSHWISNCNNDRLRQFTRELYKLCGAQCERFDKKSSVCRPTGCTCADGFTGINCDEECAAGRPPRHIRNERSNILPNYRGRRDAVDSYQCDNETLLPPSCNKELEAPEVEVKSYGQIVVSQKVEHEGDRKVLSAYFVMRVVGTNSSRRYPAIRSELLIAYVDDAIWDAKYEVYAVASVSIDGGDSIQVKSRTRAFTSTPWAARCYGIENVTKTSFTVVCHDNIEGCEDHQEKPHISIRTKSTRSKEQPRWRGVNTRLPSTISNLDANARYQVELIVKPFGILHSKSVKTLESAPGPVTNLEIFDADYDKRSISLRWQPPDPPYGEIESYHVIIEQNGKVLGYLSIGPLKHICEFQINYVCLNNLQLLRDMPNHSKVQIQVWAKNKNVKEDEVRITLSFSPDVIYNKKPEIPINLTAIHQYHGVVMIKWNPPALFSPTKIALYQIYVEAVEIYLLDSTYDQFPITLNHAVGNKNIEYSQELHLLPSTKYCVSIVSKNGRRISSDVSDVEFTIPGSPGFAGQEEPELKNNPSLIVLKIPEIVNATTNTTLKVFVKGPSKCTRHDSSPEQNLIEIVGEWLTAEYTVNNSLPKVLEISVEQHHGVELDCSLRRNEIYTILFIVKDWISDNTDEFETSKITITVGGGSSIGMILGLFVIFIVIAICSILLFGCYRKHKRSSNKPKQPIYLDILPPITSMDDVDSTSGLSEARVYSIPNEPDSRTVSIEYFEKYTKNAAASGLLYSQFMLLPRGMIKPCEIGTLPENIPKNRYRNLIAYDDTRVVLDKIPGDPHSDYINASYIRGYCKERAYIATQGPKPNTINDFWRMIWQENVRVICMMSNVVEGVTKHSEKYWPESETRMKYGNFYISNTNQRVFADFTFRTFKLSCYGDTREVTHLQFTGWPVLGMPSVQSFVVYVKKLVETPSGDGPIVVHCHRGDGRSGVLILCDISLRQAMGERTIDVTAVTTRMRNSRTDMVATPQQYLFAHIAIVESLTSIPTQLPCTKIFTNRLQKMKLQLVADLQRLEDTMWQEQALDAFAEQAPSTAVYATIDDITPDIPVVADFERSATFNQRSSAIDVVSVDGLRLKNQYLASWLPPPLALEKFWTFVAEENIQLIVVLQCSDLKNTTCSDIVPDESILLSMPHMTVKPKTVAEKGEYFTSEKLLLTDTSERITRSQTVTVLTCAGWQTGEHGTPPAPVALVSLWRASEKIPRREGETLVLCHNGSPACELYLAMCLLLERMAVAGECDVISAVRRVRKSNPRFVLSKKHGEYLYDAAEIYAECFKCYANFI